MKTFGKARSRVRAPAMPKSINAGNGPAQTDRAAASPADGALDADLHRKMDAWWRAANYLSVF